ncbi:MAG: hypothetical protein GY913_22200 [Proteobacteria bacterium]|nr:hypothetical protein [Pseudomonadota bacterium]MCP4919623.1 hypothetical protein [Pseudomonadota bacterium]
MTSRTLLLALLSAPVAVASMTVSPDAHAQDVFAAPGHFQLLGADTVTGDGVTPVTLHVVALGTDGNGMEGLKGKVTASGGTATDLVSKGEGVYEFTFTPPAVSAATDVSFTLKGKTADKASVSKSWTLGVAPAAPASVAVSANPAELILGQDKDTSLSIQLLDSAGAPAADGAVLQAHASSGTVESLTYLGNGNFTARYTAKSVKYPHLDIVTLIDERDPDKVYGVFVVKLTGKTDFPVNAAPNSTVILKVGGRDFGPYQTDTTGSVRVPIMVPPGSGNASQVTVTAGVTTEDALDLKIPETRRIALFPAGSTVAGDSSQPVTLRAAVRTPTGEEDGSAKVTFTAAKGTVGAAKHVGGGVYEATWSPPDLTSAEDIEVGVSIDGEPGVQSDKLALSAAPAPAGSIALTAEPAELATGATGFSIYTKVTGSSGKGLDGREVIYLTSGAKVKETKDLKSGDYRTTFSTTTAEGVAVTAMAPGAVSGAPLDRIILLPDTERIANDGRTLASVVVLSVDRSGYPVANVSANLKLSGDGKLAKTVTTDENGAARVYYTAGTNPGINVLTATSGDVTGTASIAQIPADAAAGLDLPNSGDAATRAANDRFAGAVSTVVIGREGSTAVAAADAAEMSGAVGALEALGLSASPAEVAPGGSVNVLINATDSSGRGVAGQALNVLATGGKISSVTDHGGGSYSATLTAPNDASGTLMVVATSADGGVSQALSVTVNAPLWGTVETEPTAVVEADPAETTPVVEPAEVVTTTPLVETPKPPREPGDFPLMRARLGFAYGTYAYQQVPEEVESVLWPDTVRMGFGEDSAPAGAPGFDVNVQGWSPDLVGGLGVGGEFQARTLFYSVPWPGTDATVPDQVPHVTALAKARYRFEAGDNQFHVGAKGGYYYSDFITYQTGEQEGFLDYNSLALHAWAVGGEIGAEFGDIAHVRADIVQGFYGTSAYSTNVAFDVGVSPFPDVPVFLGGSFQLSRRSIEVVAAGETPVKVGQLDDTSTLFVVGPGVQF